MRIFITGGTGLIGQRIAQHRIARGDEVVILTRNKTAAAVELRNSAEIIEGDPTSTGDWQRRLIECDAIIHLAGASVAGRRWTKSYKRVLYDSRIKSTQQITAALRNVNRAITFISGSAVGYYGDGGDAILTEESGAGDDFLARLCVDWEAAAMQAASERIRVTTLRTGIVLDSRGGALPMMMLPFRFFMGGPIGWGRHWQSWIHWRDMVGLVDLILDNAIDGPLNATAPNPVRASELARSLGRAMHRPSFMHVPKFMIRIAMGEVAGAMTASQRVVPAKALNAGYQFAFSQIDAALDDL